MKNLITAALLFITVSTSALALDPVKINAVFLRHFDFEFPEASNVAWAVKSDFVKATFTLNNQHRTAIFDLNGDLIATSKNISLDDLPINAKRTFAKKYDGYTVTEAIRFEGFDDAAYYISADNEKESVIVKIGDNSELSIFKKTKK